MLSTPPENNYHIQATFTIQTHLVPSVRESQSESVRRSLLFSIWDENENERRLATEVISLKTAERAKSNALVPVYSTWRRTIEFPRTDGQSCRNKETKQIPKMKEKKKKKVKKSCLFLVWSNDYRTKEERPNERLSRKGGFLLSFDPIVFIFRFLTLSQLTDNSTP
jgi:hypothetical protein